MFLVGFNLKIAKEDLNVKGKYGIPPWHLRGKGLEASRSHVTEAEGKTPPGGAAPPVGRSAPMGPTYQPSSTSVLPPPLRMHLSRCLNRFILRAHVAPLGLYNQTLAPLAHSDQKSSSHL